MSFRRWNDLTTIVVRAYTQRFYPISLSTVIHQKANLFLLSNRYYPVPKEREQCCENETFINRKTLLKNAKHRVLSWNVAQVLIAWRGLKWGSPLLRNDSARSGDGPVEWGWIGGVGMDRRNGDPHSSEMTARGVGMTCGVGVVRRSGDPHSSETTVVGLASRSRDLHWARHVVRSSVPRRFSTRYFNTLRITSFPGTRVSAKTGGVENFHASTEHGTWFLYVSSPPFRPGFDGWRKSRENRTLYRFPAINAR